MARNDPKMTRDQSLSAKPIAGKIVSRVPLPDGGARVTVAVEPQGVYKWLLRIPGPLKRDYELDAIGLEVLDLCDGQKTVQYMIKQIAKRHQLSPVEAQRATVNFLRSMISRGMVQVMVD